MHLSQKWLEIEQNRQHFGIRWIFIDINIFEHFENFKKIVKISTNINLHLSHKRGDRAKQTKFWDLLNVNDFLTQ